MKNYFLGILISVLVLIDMIINVVVSVLGVKKYYMELARKLFGKNAKELIVKSSDDEYDYKDKLIKSQEVELGKIKLAVRNHIIINKCDDKALFDMCKY